MINEEITLTKDQIAQLLLIREDEVGIHGVNPFFEHNSSPRAMMFGSHISQCLVLVNTEEKLIQTKADKELGKYTFAIKAPCNMRVLYVVERYSRTVEGDIPFSPELTVIYEDTDTGEYGHISIPHYAKYHQYFGFPYKKNPEMDKILPGMSIPKDTVFVDSIAKKENGGYGYGTNLNIAFMNIPEVSEDAVLISKQALEKLKFKIYETRVVEFGKHGFPINLYGDPDNYKAFPELGETLHESGILMAIRSHNVELTPVNLSKYGVCKYDPYFDEAIYVRGPEGKVIDIKITHTPQAKPFLYSNMEKQMVKYIEGLKRYYARLISIERELRENNKKRGGTGEITLKPDFSRLLVEAYSYVDGYWNPTTRNGVRKVKRNFKGEPVDEFRIEFTIEYTITPDIGFKLTCQNGGKGVICHIWGEKDMPRDEQGNVADIVVKNTSTINRMNLGRLYEVYIGSAIRDTTKRIRDQLNASELEGKSSSEIRKYLESLSDDHITRVYNEYLEFLSIVSPVQYDFYSKLSDSEKIEALQDIIEDTIRVYYPIRKEKEPLDIIEELNNSKFKPFMGPVTYTRPDGVTYTTEKPIRIGPIYILLLEKIADSLLATNVGRTNHFGVLAPITKANKHQLPYRNTPPRTTGESELRVYLTEGGPRCAAEIMDRNNNLQTMAEIYRNILNADEPTNIKTIVDRKKIPFGNTSPLKLMRHILFCNGIGVTYEEEDQ